MRATPAKSLILAALLSCSALSAAHELTYFGRRGHPINATYKDGELSSVELFSFPSGKPLDNNPVVLAFLKKEGLNGYLLNGTPVRVHVLEAREPVGYESFFTTTVVALDGKEIEQAEAFYWTSDVNLRFVRLKASPFKTVRSSALLLAAKTEARKPISVAPEDPRKLNPRLLGPVRTKVLGSPEGYPELVLVSYTYKVLGAPKTYNPFNERWGEFLRVDLLVKADKNTVLYTNTEWSGDAKEDGRFFFVKVDGKKLFMGNAVECFDGSSTVLFDVTSASPIDTSKWAYTCWPE